MINLKDHIVILTSPSRQLHSAHPSRINRSRLFDRPFTFSCQTDLSTGGFLMAIFGKSTPMGIPNEVSLYVDEQNTNIIAQFCDTTYPEPIKLSVPYSKKEEIQTITFSLGRDSMVLRVGAEMREKEINKWVNDFADFEMYLGGPGLHSEDKFNFRGKVTSCEIYSRHTSTGDVESIESSIVQRLDFRNRTPWKIFDESLNNLHAFYFNRNEFR